MSQSAIATPQFPTVKIPLGTIVPWAIFFGLLALLALFFVGADQGAISLPAGNAIHEWVHDARHLLGFPCH